MRTSRGKVLLGIVFLLALMIGWPIVVHFRAKAAVRAYDKQLRAQGEKLTIDELIPPRTATGANGAAAFLSAARRLSSLDFNYEPSRMKALAPGHARVAWMQEVLPTEESTNIWPKLHEFIEQDARVLAEAREALKNPVLDFGLDYHQGFRLSLRHLVVLKTTVQRFSCESSLAMHEGRREVAWADMLACAALQQAWQNEPLLISQLVRHAISRIVFASTWEALQYPGWSDQQLAELQARWQATGFSEIVESTFSMERAWGEGAFELWRRDYNQSLGSVGTFGAAAGGSGNLVSDLIDIGKGVWDDPKAALDKLADQYPRFWAWKWWRSYDEELYLKKCWQIGLDSIRLANRKRCFVPALRECQNARQSLAREFDQVKHSFITEAYDAADAVESYIQRVAFAETQKEMLVAAIALKRYQLRHGKLPSELTALIPEFLKALPYDWMDGRELRYRLHPDGQFLLYSVGEDGVDDGGDARPKTPTEIGDISKGRDWVWPTPASAQEITDYNDGMAKKRNKRR